MDENEKISDEVLKSLEGKKLRCDIRGIGTGKDLIIEECITIALRQVQKRKDDHVLQKPKVVAV